MKAVLVALVIIGCLSMSTVDCFFKKYKKSSYRAPPAYYCGDCGAPLQYSYRPYSYNYYPRTSMPYQVPQAYGIPQQPQEGTFFGYYSSGSHQPHVGYYRK